MYTYIVLRKMSHQNGANKTRQNAQSTADTLQNT